MSKNKKQHFYVNKTKGVVVARLWNKHGVDVRAKATCADSDTFDESVGKDLAETRARIKYLEANRQRYKKKASSLRAQAESFDSACVEIETKIKELRGMEDAVLDTIRNNSVTHD